MENKNQIIIENDLWAENIIVNLHNEVLEEDIYVKTVQWTYLMWDRIDFDENIVEHRNQ